MFYHIKDLQFNARVSQPDPRFARLLLDAFGGANGELKSAMQYFVQAFGCRKPMPDKYDMLMDIATEELAHLEIVGATIQMLLGPVGGKMKDVVENMEINTLMGGKTSKEDFIHQAYTNPAFLITAQGPMLTDCNGNPWSGAYVHANNEPTVDLRSNMAGEARAKICYEYLMPLTDDPAVRETLGFLMTREVTHYQQFEAALATIEQNFPPGVLQTDPRYSNLYFNMSKGDDKLGPWNQGESSQLKEEWQYIDRPAKHVYETNGLLNQEPRGTHRNPEKLRKTEEKLSQERSSRVLDSQKEKNMQWSDYSCDCKQEKQKDSKQKAAIYT